MKVGSRVELFEAIRRDHRREELSIRQLAARHQVHRRTVRQALESAQPPARQPPQRAAPKMEVARPLIDAMLREDLDAPRKRRHTARRGLARLADDHNISDVSYSTVRDYVARRRPEINIEAGGMMESVFVPQSHPPGAEGEVDFAGHPAAEAGYRVKCTLAPKLVNESFSGWTKTFTDPRLCAAIVDRLTFGGHIIETGTDSTGWPTLAQRS